MRCSTVSICAVALLACFICVAEAAYMRVCYYFDPDNLPVSSVNFTVCSHVLYYGVQCNASDNYRFYWAKPSDENAINALKAARNTYNFKLMAVLGGSLAAMCDNQNNMTRFANSAAAFLRQSQLDGLDTDWEFPKLQYRAAFASLMQTVRTAFDAGTPTLPKLLLSAAVPGDRFLIEESYDIPSLAQSWDFVDIMGYDYRFWGNGLNFAGLHSPLYAPSNALSYAKTQNLNASASYFLNHGMPASKIVLGLPTYSHGWILSYPILFNGVFAPASGPANPESLQYREICAFLLQSGTVRVWESSAQSPYAYNGNRWYSFDDAQSATAKANYVKQHGFAGVMMWSLWSDSDFNHACGTGTDFPIHSLMTDLLT